MNEDTEELSIEDFVYLNFGYDLGTCDECNEPAATYDEDGRLLCEECLMQRLMKIIPEPIPDIDYSELDFED